MADIAAGDVTYSVTKQRKEESGNKINSVTITYGNSTLTYPSGGIPLTKASMGCPNAIVSAQIDAANSADGIIYKYDKANNKIRMYRSAGFTPAGTVAAPVFTGSALAGHTHAIAVTAGTAGDAVTNNAGVLESTGGQDLATSSDTAGTPAGTNSAPAFTGSAVAAGNLVELSSGSTAVVAATVYMEVVGW